MNGDATIKLSGRLSKVDQALHQIEHIHWHILASRSRLLRIILDY